MRRLFTSLAIGTVIAANLQAAVVIDNLNSTTNGFSTGLTGPVGNGILGAPRESETAFTFTTGPDADALVSLESVVSIVNSATPFVATLSTGPSVPGGTNSITIGSASPSGTFGSITTVTLTPTVPIPLAANTTYWVHYTVPTGNGWYGILHAESPTTQLDFTLGTSWSKTILSPWSDITPQARVRITTVNPVPEPAISLLGSIGTLLLLRRRRSH